MLSLVIQFVVLERSVSIRRKCLLREGGRTVDLRGRPTSIISPRHKGTLLNMEREVVGSPKGWEKLSVVTIVLLVIHLLVLEKHVIARRHHHLV
jgi:hypothetical protein